MLLAHYVPQENRKLPAVKKGVCKLSHSPSTFPHRYPFGIRRVFGNLVARRRWRRGEKKTREWPNFIRKVIPPDLTIIGAHCVPKSEAGQLPFLSCLQALLRASTVAVALVAFKLRITRSPLYLYTCSETAFQQTDKKTIFLNTVYCRYCSSSRASQAKNSRK